VTAYQYTGAGDDATAVMGRRTVAAIVDGLVVGVPPIIVATTDVEYLEEEDVGVPLDDFCDIYQEQNDVSACASIGDRVYFTDEASPAAALLGLGLGLLIFVVLQGAKGLTPGKALLGIRTVGEDGQVPGIGKALIRWLLLVVDAAPWCVPLVGFVTALVSTGHRRVGDMAAKTFVVGKASAGRPIVVPGLVSAYGAPGYPGPGGPGAPAPGTGWGAPPPAAPPPAGSPQPGGWGTGPAGYASPASPPGGDARPAPPSPGPSGWAPPSGESPAAGTAAAPAPSAAASGPSAPGGGPRADEPDRTVPFSPAGATPGPTVEVGEPAPSGEQPGGDDEAQAGGAPAGEPIPVAETGEPSGGQARGPGDEDESAAERPVGGVTEADPAEPDAAPGPGPQPATPAPSDETPAASPPPDDSAGQAGAAAPAGQTPSPQPAGSTPAATTGGPQATYNPQWDAARGTYIVWEPGRAKWLAWDDTAKEWKVL